ncbi:DMT family transporter [Pelosinus sp. UFO1]|uniref:DMT family transporter n=1 Tax=Pelosinus sp. UFO1 TaxID=484770 RepID=UPI0004D0F07E|nr:DMT family transporter [Pelosinus sp. UFO1]AIF54146.1 protein of unknown function DUF6 transmembrane [Pelosinus sp. UFO1]
MLQSEKAYLAAFVYSLIIGFSFMFTKLALAIASPMDTLAHRFTISFLIASIPFLAKKAQLNMNYKDLIAILPLAILYPTLFFTFQAFGLVYISSSEAGIIQAVIPLFTVFLAGHFLNEYPTTQQKISILLSVMGVIYIFFMKSSGLEVANLQGALLILLSALSAACYNVLARNLTKRYALYKLTYIMTMIGFITFNIIAIIQHNIDHTLSYFFAPFGNQEFLLSIFYLGILSSLGTSFLSNYALSKLEASKMSVFSNLATLITIIAGVLVLHEKLQYFHLIGGSLILIGVIGTNYFNTKKVVNQ